MPENSHSLVKTSRPELSASAIGAIEGRTLAPQQLSIAEVLKTLSKRKVAILSVATIIFLGVAAYTFSRTPVYEGVARLKLIQTYRPASVWITLTSLPRLTPIVD